MKKLLHERLREHADLGCMSFIGSGYDLALWPEETRALADEIDRYYIPRPRFEDGEPVGAGDEAEYEKAESATVEWYTVDDDGMFHICLGRIADIEGHVGTDFVKRPSPKVLDADGVEIKVGDTVWSKVSGYKYIVNRLCNNDTVDVSLPSNSSTVGGFNACVLTHKEPDSLEKLRDDMHREWLIGYEIGKEKARDWSDRLSALIGKED